MAQINLVTGYTGEAHITSADDAALNNFLSKYATTNYAFLLNDFEYSYTTTSLSVKGHVLMNGRLGNISETETKTFDAVSEGSKRGDYLVVDYLLYADGTEAMQLRFLQRYSLHLKAKMLSAL